MFRIACTCLLGLSFHVLSAQLPTADTLLSIEDHEVFLSAIQQGYSSFEQDSLLMSWHLRKAKTAKLAANARQREYHLTAALLVATDQEGLEKLQIQAYLELADRQRIKQNKDSALTLVQQALEVSQQIGNRALEGQCLYNFASIIEYMDENPMVAIDYLLQAKGIFEEIEDKERLANVHILMGIVHVKSNDPFKSITYYKLAQQYYEEVADTLYQTRMAVNLGMSYHRIDEIDSSILSYQKAESLIKDPDGLATAFLNVNYANVLIEVDQYEEAIRRLKISNAIFTRIEDQYGINITLYHIGEAYLDKGDPSTAIDIFLQVEKAIEDFVMNNIRETLYKDLNYAYTGVGNYKKALEYAQKQIVLSDSLQKQEYRKQVALLEQRYALEKKEAENQSLRQQAEMREAEIQRQKEWSIAVAIALFLISGFAAFVFWTQRKTARLNKTVQKQADKLKAINDAKSQLFANISHDFRTPLTLISGQVQLLLDDNQHILPSDAIARLHKISWNNNRLISLTEEIRELISLDSGNIKIDKQVVDIKSFVALQTGLFQSAAEEKGISLTQRFDAPEISVCMDSFKMEKVFYNLLSNALKFTKEGGTIHVELSQRKNQVMVAVRDSGIGIGPEHLDHVFDRYYQIDTNDYKIEQGLGIGLAITKELIELHDGTIDVISEKSVGTTFTVSLPISLEEQESQQIQSTAITTEPGHTTNKPLMREQPAKGCILVVDDHPEIRAYVRDLLKEDFELYLAENGWSALETLKEKKVDVIITDIMMPVMDGFVLIEALKAEDRWKNIPVVAISARTGQEDKERVLKLGVADYMIKPFNSREFKLRIANLVELRKKDQALPASLQHYNLQKLEEEWLSKLSSIVKDNLGEKVSNSMLANEMAMSERTLYRVLKDLTGLTPLEYVKQVKFQYARKLMTEGKVKSLNDAGKAIGIHNVTRFKHQYKAFYDEEPIAGD